MQFLSAKELVEEEISLRSSHRHRSFGDLTGGALYDFYKQHTTVKISEQDCTNLHTRVYKI